jgi:hypothetical protein
MKLYGITDTLLCQYWSQKLSVLSMLAQIFSPLIALREEIGDQFVESSYNLNSSTSYNTTLPIALFLFKLAINGIDTENCIIVLKVKFVEIRSSSGYAGFFNLL